MVATSMKNNIYDEIQTQVVSLDFSTYLYLKYDDPWHLVISQVMSPVIIKRNFKFIADSDSHYHDD